jgi:hypothetical protein
VVDVRFGDQIYKILVKIPLRNIKGMIGESFYFFKPDLKTYVISCGEEGFIIHKDVEIKKLKTYLFMKYVPIKVGMDVESEEGKLRHESVFFDKNEYQHHSFVNAKMFYDFLEPLSKITEKKSKDEGNINTNRVHFYNNHAIIVCACKSFIASDYPNGVKFPEVTVGTSFINLLFALMSKPHPSQALEIRVMDNKRIKVISEDFELSGSCYSRLNLDDIEDFEDIALSFHDNKFTWIDTYLLERIVKYSNNMRLSAKTLLFNYGNGGDIKCIALHKDDNKDYNYINYLNPHKQHDFAPFDKPVVVSSQSLGRLLNAFSDRHNVGILIRDKQVIVKNNNRSMHIVLTSMASDK